MNVITCIDRFARESPDHPAVILDGGGDGKDTVVTYGRLRAGYRHSAARFREQGCKRYDRCGMLCSQSYEFIESALGILAAGMCFVPISADYDGAALQFFIDGTRLNHLIRQDEGFRVRTFPKAGAVDDAKDEDYRGTDPAYIRFTSGTTSSRKGVLIGHQSILDRLAAANEGLRIGPSDRIMWTLPMAHHFVVSILLYLRFGATILLPRGHLSEPILDMANRHGATVFYASPYQYDLLAQDSSKRMLPAVRLAISTTSALRTSVSRNFYERMEVPLSQALGVIEMGLPVINTARAREKPSSLGQVLPGYSVILRDESGAAVDPHGEPAPGEEHPAGVIHIRGPGSFDAYLNPWTAASDVIEPLGFNTGDQAYFDADGDLHVLGRRHNRINMAGMKFFCEEVEQVIASHPRVKECRVRGVAHRHLGEIPVVDVVPADPADPPLFAAIRDFCHGALPAHKIPLYMELLPHLPRTSTGKIKRW